MALFASRQQTGAAPALWSRAVSPVRSLRDEQQQNTRLFSFPVSPGLHPTPATVTRIL